MAPSPRKRFNAFNDFPASETNPADQSAVQNEPVQAVKPAIVVENTAAERQVERIERLKPSQMMPDRFQPRRLLPAALRPAFFSGQSDCYKSAAAWLEIARSDAHQHAEIERLLAMGLSFDQHGQIKPITGSWTKPGGSFIFLIETGERRFWAACLQRVSQNLPGEPLLRVEAISNPTRQRQVLENRHAEPPSAVGQACEVASLILAELGLLPDATLNDEFDYFRQARAQRMPTGMWERLMPVMQLTRPRMVQLLNLLQMPTPLLDLADRSRLPERVLREVLSLPHEQWEQALKTAVQRHLTSDEVAEMGERAAFGEEEPARHNTPLPYAPARTAVSGLRRFAKSLVELDEFSRTQALDEIADSLVATHQAEGLINLLSELSVLVQARLTRR
jgi:hypothetical protein